MNDIEKIVSAGHLYLASSFETVGTSWCRGEGAPACLQGESSEMPQRHSFCDQGFRLRHCPAATEASVRLDAIQDWRGQSGENKELPGNLISARQSYRSSLTWKCESIRSEFDMLIEDKAQGDNDGWSKVWHLVHQELHSC